MVLHDSVEYGPGGGIGVVAGVGLAVRIIGLVYGDIGVVCVSAAGHRDVEVLLNLPASIIPGSIQWSPDANAVEHLPVDSH